MRLLRPALLCTLLLLAACPSSEPPTAPSPEPTPTDTTSPEPAASPTPPESPAAPVSPGPTTGTGECAPQTGGGDTFLQLVDVRIGTHAGYDRIVFEFEPPSGDSPPAPPGVLPQYRLEPVEQVTEDGSGNPVELAGDQLFTIVFQGASGADLSGEEVVLTYDGPREFQPDFPVLEELEDAGDFEAVLTWGFGVNTDACPNTTEFTDPLRLAIDIPS